MFNDEDLSAFAPRPFWFVGAELLADIWRVEIRAIIDLFANHSGLRQLFDASEATTPQRTVCFELLAHRKIMEMVDETALGRYDDLPAFNDEESAAFRRSQNLVSSDAPAWVLEMNEVAEWLPVRIHRALPEPLRQEGFYRNDPAQDEAVRSAANTLSTVEQIQALTARVFDEQLQRLRERWSVGERSSASIEHVGEPKKPKYWKKGTEGLTHKSDFSQYKRGLTPKQELAFSLEYEYALPLSEIAARMGLNRKTAYEHIKAAEKKIKEVRSSEKRKAQSAKRTPAE